jgi:hypothetical protein
MEKKNFLHGINCLRLSVIDLLNITESCYTNFDALFANWSADDKDNLETIMIIKSFFYAWGNAALRL